MKTTCVIDHYNCSAYIGEAVESALAQSVAFDEIIVVDDASTDGAQDLLRSRYGPDSRVRLVLKDQNQGQLSTLTTGWKLATGDLVYFLDGDDFYEPTYLAETLSVYDSHPKCDCVFVSCSQLKQLIERGLRNGVDQDLGYAAALTYYRKTWIGGPTSCLSFRKPVLDGLLPYPHATDWKVRADDCLNFGSSLLGGRKFYLAKELVQFRIHGDNNSSKCSDRDSIYLRKLALNRLFEFYRQRAGFDAVRLADLVHREFRTQPAPTWKRASQYLRLLLGSNLPISRRLALSVSVLSHRVFCHRRVDGGDGELRHNPEPHVWSFLPERCQS